MFGNVSNTFWYRHKPFKHQKKPSNRRSDNDASESGGHDKCCPHVVDPWLFLGILAGLAVTTFLLRMQITMFIMGRKRRKRNAVNEIDSTSRANSNLIEFKWDRAYKYLMAGNWIIKKGACCIIIARSIHNKIWNSITL